MVYADIPCTNIDKPDAVYSMHLNNAGIRNYFGKYNIYAIKYARNTPNCCMMKMMG